MSASSYSFPNQPGPDVLGELLHSLSQPLTSLRCSLELSLDLSPDEVADQRQEGVVAALEQTERVVDMIQLMREYLDAEQSVPGAFSSSLAPTLKSVVEELTTIAETRGVQLRLVGACTATVPVAKSRLRLALQYLIAAVIEAQSAGGKVTLLLGESPAGAVLRVAGERGFRRLKQNVASTPTLRRVRLAIATRVLENAGASLLVSGGNGECAGPEPAGFVLRIPCRYGAPAREY